MTGDQAHASAAFDDDDDSGDDWWLQSPITCYCEHASANLGITNATSDYDITLRHDIMVLLVLSS